MSGNPIFSRLFGRSPVAPLLDHMKVSADCALVLPQYFQAVIDEDWVLAEKRYDEICELEDRADDLKREIRVNLPRSLFLPVSRTDILEILQMQDRIPNRAKDIAGLTLGRKMSIPEIMRPLLLEYVEVSVSATTFALKVLNELGELVKTGFSGHEIDLIEGMLGQLSDVEHDSDVKQVEVRSKLMSLEYDLNPVDVMFMYRIIDWIGDLADDSQTVGNRMLYLIAR